MKTLVQSVLGLLFIVISACEKVSEEVPPVIDPIENPVVLKEFEYRPYRFLISYNDKGYPDTAWISGTSSPEPTPVYIQVFSYSGNNITSKMYQLNGNMQQGPLFNITEVKLDAITGNLLQRRTTYYNDGAPVPGSPVYGVNYIYVNGKAVAGENMDGFRGRWTFSSAGNYLSIDSVDKGSDFDRFFTYQLQQYDNRPNYFGKSPIGLIMYEFFGQKIGLFSDMLSDNYLVKKEYEVRVRMKDPVTGEYTSSENANVFNHSDKYTYTFDEAGFPKNCLIENSVRVFENGTERTDLATQTISTRKFRFARLN